MHTENSAPCIEEGNCSPRWPVHYVDLCERGAAAGADSIANRSQTPVHLVSFASSDYAPSLRRLAQQAEAMSTFASITTTTEEDLEPSFRAKFSEYLQPGVRGFGYWMWKPEVILRTLERIPEGEVLLYLDAGCHLNPAGRARFSQYVEWAAKSASGLLAFQYRSFSSAPANYPIERAKILLDKHYTKREALEALEIDPQSPLLDDPAIAGGIIFVKKCSESIATLRLWREAVDKHPSAFTDELDRSVQDSSFRDTRHDQAIFSIRAKERGIETVSAYETWVPKTSSQQPDWSPLGRFPIHARRDLKKRRSAKDSLGTLRRQLRGVIDKVSSRHSQNPD
jgi:hypothetical protein